MPDAERVWLVYSTDHWHPEPAVVVRGARPAERQGYRIEGPFVLERALDEERGR
jgi:hypothetical protein